MLDGSHRTDATWPWNPAGVSLALSAVQPVTSRGRSRMNAEGTGMPLLPVLLFEPEGRVAACVVVLVALWVSWDDLNGQKCPTPATTR